jgi:hypothetical protein
VLVVEAEQEVPLKRLAQVEPEAHPTREVHDPVAPLGNGQQVAQPTLAAKVEAAEPRVDETLEECHRYGLPVPGPSSSSTASGTPASGRTAYVPSVAIASSCVPVSSRTAGLV